MRGYISAHLALQTDQSIRWSAIYHTFVPSISRTRKCTLIYWLGPDMSGLFSSVKTPERRLYPSLSAALRMAWYSCSIHPAERHIV